MATLFKKKTSRRGKESASSGKKKRSAKSQSGNGGNAYFKNSRQILEAALLLLFAAIVISVCFLGQKPRGPQAILNQPAPSRIVAEFPFMFESELLREQKIASERARIPPVFKRTFEPFKAFSDYINKLNSSIAKTLIDYESKGKDKLLLEYQAAGEEALQMALNETIGDLASGADYKINPETIMQFTKMANPRERLELTNSAIDILRAIHEDGIHSNLETGKGLPQVAVVQLTDEAGKQNLPYARSLEDSFVALRIRLDGLSGNRETSRILFDIFRHGLKENLVYSEAATKEATDDAIEKIPPQIVSFKEGDTLIEPGQIVTEKAIEALAAYRTEERSLGSNSLIFNDLFLKRTILTLLLIIAIAACCKYGLPEFYKNNHAILITATSIVLNLLVMRLIMEVGYNVLDKNSPFLALLPYLAPYTFAPILIAALVGIGPAIVSALFISVLFGILQDNSIEFLLIVFLSSAVSSFIASKITKRAMLVQAGTIAGATAGCAILVLGMVGNLSLTVVSEQALISVIVGVLTGVVAVGILPLFEQLFKMTTDITLLELTDFNHPLLRRMQMEAPGTYHHSLMVANLSENAAAKIGASPLLCRVCCFFHDIGKLVKPEYFTENQTGGINPHEAQNPSMSALVIKAHVKEGVELATKYKLPEVIIDVIRQHHGTGLIQYFYHQAQQKQNKQIDLPICDEHIKPNGSRKVDESTYRYDGPRPAFKESAIIFFADSVEAASRCLKKVTQPALEELIDNIITSRIDDGQLDECPLTFQELYAIKSSFTYTLLNMLHSRIEYPKEAKEKIAESFTKAKQKQDNEPVATGSQQPA